MGTQYTICHWAINRSDPQNLLSVTLDVPLQEMPLLFQCTDDSEHLLIMNLVILLHRRQELAVKGHQVPLLFSGQSLGKDGSGGEVRTVSLDAEGFRVLG